MPFDNPYNIESPYNNSFTDFSRYAPNGYVQNNSAGPSSNVKWHQQQMGVGGQAAAMGGGMLMDFMSPGSRQVDTSSISNVGRVGATGFGTAANQVGNVGISTGNPYLALAGLGAKMVGNIGNSISAITRDNPDLEELDTSFGFDQYGEADYTGIGQAFEQYNQDQSEISNISGKKAFWDQVKSVPSPLGVGLGIIGSKKARKQKQDYEQQQQERFVKLRQAQQSFNASKLSSSLNRYGQEFKRQQLERKYYG